nr:alpha-(1,3)-fucosyltransferase C-like [Procambarus clarkii]
MKNLQLETSLSSSQHKKILFYGSFFFGPWESFVGNMTTLEENNCPESKCIFLYNTSHPEGADAVIFHHGVFNKDNVPGVRLPHQRYVWLNLEAPSLINLNNTQQLQHIADEKWFGVDGFFNWSYSYNRESDLVMLYGGLRSLRGEPDPPRPGLLDTSGATYTDYIAALDRGDQLLQDDPDHHWHAFMSRPKTVAWMVSHCSTVSGREFYVKELQKHMSVDVYGLCGDLRCSKNHQNLDCYADVLRPKYKFYLAFENNMCQDYITEKVWLPLHHGLVPVVYGGANYSLFLPPHSYVDATHLTPPQLASLLTRLSSSRQQYAQYHLWRRYWRVLVKPPMCELCWKLHHNHSSTTLHQLGVWWRSVNHCVTRYPAHLYPRRPEPDTRSLTQKLSDSAHLLGGLFLNVAQSLLPRVHNHL